MEKKLKYPELEQGNYEAQTEAIIKQSKDMADAQEKRAKRDRDMAILGDIANMVSKGAAMHGGAWKMNKDESMAAQGNAKLRALQESNSKQLGEYAKMRMNAADADRKERNAQKVAEYNADVNAYKSAVEAAKYAKEQERKDRQEARSAAESDAKIAREKAQADYYNNGGYSTGKAKNMRYLNGWGFNLDSGAEVAEAYARMVQADPDKAVKKYSLLERDFVAVPNPNSQQMIAALTKGGMTKEPRGSGVQWDDETNEIDEDFR